MYTDTFIIEFIDGTSKRISNAKDMMLDDDRNCFQLVKNGYRIFVPRENVKFIGREFDLAEEE